MDVTGTARVAQTLGDKAIMAGVRQKKRNRKRGERIAETMARGMALHRQGNVREADQCYARVLELTPHHADALHLSGLIADQLGEPERAVELITRATLTNPRAADYFSNLGAVLKKAGRLDEAAKTLREAVRLAPNNPLAVFNLGSVLLSLRQFKEAKSHIEKALLLKPGFAQAHNSLGNVFLHQRDLPQAVEQFNCAIDANPHYASPYNNLGIALQRLGDAAAAITVLHRAIALKPDYAEAYNNLVAAYRGAGQPEQAVPAIRQLLALQPHNAAAWQNLGFVYRDQGRIVDALQAHKRCLELAPAEAGFQFNLAELLKEIGRPDAALSFFQAAMHLAPQNSLYQQGLSRCLSQVRIATVDSQLRGQLLVCLKNEGINPAGVLKAAAVHAKQVAAGAAEQPSSRTEMYTDLASAWPVLTDPLFSHAMAAGVIADREIEVFLTATRRAFLLYLSREPPADLDCAHWIPAICALAQQCFLNEHVYSQDQQQSELVHHWRHRATTAGPADSEVRQLILAVLASYLPLVQVIAVDNAKHLSEATEFAAIKDLIQRQVLGIAEEQAIAPDIPVLTPISTATSAAVRAQYEANPYPRWLRCTCHEPHSLQSVLRAVFPAQSATDLVAPTAPAILIAGCGTGNQALESARRISQADFLAMDLSRSSLAYAIRKARSMGIDNIEFVQGDLLELECLNRDFDLIECCGVLHHLQDPIAGWRRLLTRLRPGGYMKIALYSEVARRSVIAARELIAAAGLGADSGSIRRFREDIFALAETHPAAPVRQWRDFFSTSECRDLIFHVQERRFTLPEIETALQELGLRFLGFEMEGQVSGYLARYPEDSRATNLDNWHEYELANPNTFKSMYQFWVKKPD